MTIRALLATLFVTFALASGASAAASPTLACQQAKLAALGKLKSCLLINKAKVLGSKPDKSADCRSKFASTLAGADAAAAKQGAACRFVDNGDGTVADLDTGLTWEKKVAGSGCTHCVDDAYTWSAAGAARDGSAFTNFLRTLNTQTSVTGHGVATPCFANRCDWRLPTIEEWKAVLSPTLAPSIDPAFGATKAAPYWSATSSSSDAGAAWTVDFTQPGTAGTQPKVASGIHVRAVRGELP